MDHTTITMASVPPSIIFMSGSRCAGAPGAESLGGRSGARGPTGGLESLGRVKLDTAARERPGGQPECITPVTVVTRYGAGTT